MKHLDLFSGIGGFSLAAQRCWKENYGNIGHSEIDENGCTIFHEHIKDSECLGDIRKISFSRQGSLAKTLPLLESEKDLPAKERDCSMSWQGLLRKLNQSGLCSKMFPDFFLSTAGEIWRSSLPSFPKSGIAWRGECLMLDTSEWLKEEEGCGLSEVLEIHAPPKYYLSRKAVQGMIRRSRQGKNGELQVAFLRDGEKQTTSLKRMSLKQLLLVCGETLEEYGKALILRKLMPIEKERLMGYNDNYTASLKSDGKRGTGLGNAIVPQVAFEIFRAIAAVSV